MMKVAQHLWFEKDMEAALQFYTSVIPGSSILWISAVPADNPSGPAGSVKIAAFTIGDQRYMAVQAGPLDPFNHSFSIVVECAEPEGPYGAKGLGEPGLAPTPAAIGNAVANALGVRVYDLPLKPENVYGAIQNQKKKTAA